MSGCVNIHQGRAGEVRRVSNEGQNGSIVLASALWRARGGESQLYRLLVFELPSCALGGAVAEMVSIELNLDVGHIKDRLYRSLDGGCR